MPIPKCLKCGFSMIRFEGEENWTCAHCQDGKLKDHQAKIIEYQTRLMEMWNSEKENAIDKRITSILGHKPSHEEVSGQCERYLTPGAGEFWAFRGRIILHTQMFMGVKAEGKKADVVFRIDELDEPDDEDSRRKLITQYTPKMP